jgi:hypothetical protein
VILEDNEMVVIDLEKYSIYSSGKEIDKKASDMDITYKI